MTKGKLLLTLFIGFILVSLVAFFGFSLGQGKLPALTRPSLVSRLPKLYVVQSGSMEPSIKTASLIITTPKNSYWTGDVITFYKNGNKKRPITHRIVAKLYPEGIDAEPTYLTAGDANEDVDSWRIKNTDIVGEVAVSVPYLGYLVDFAKKPYGFILFVIVPATIIIYEEFRTLFFELIKQIKKVFKKKSSPLFKKQGSRIPKVSVAIPILGALIVIAGISAAFFFDNEESLDNIFSAAGDFGLTPTPTTTPPLSPTPTPSPSQTKLVINEVYYDVDNDHKQPSGADERDFEWVELYNAGVSTVNIKDWKIIDNSGTQRTISSSNRNIDPGQFAILAKAANVFVQWTIPSSAEKIPLGERFGNGLANGGDIVILRDNNGVEVDRMSWGTNLEGFTPNCIAICKTVSEGQSLERVPDGNDTDSESDFFLTDPPTPGS